MSRAKKGQAPARKKKKKKVLKETKGYKWSRKSKYRAAKEALEHARKHAYQDRKKKKREFRKLWQTQINAAARQHGMPYSKFMHGLKEQKIQLNRKMLAELAREHASTFENLVQKAKS